MHVAVTTDWVNVVKTAVLAFSVLWTIPLVAFAQQDATDIKALLHEVRALKDANEHLRQRVDDLERRLATTPVPAAAPAPSPPPASDAEPAALPPHAVPENAVGLAAYWDDGLRFKTTDDAFRLHVGGMIMFDAGFFDVPDYWRLGGEAVDEEDGTEFRRLRLTLSGEIYSDYFYEFEVDFADSDVDIIDAYAGMRNIPGVGTVMAGQFAEPMGLEALTSAGDLMFMERSMATQALVPFRSRGLAAMRTLFDERLHLSAGVFNGGLDQESHWNVTGRVAASPWYANEGRQVLHLGVAVSHRDPDGDYRFAAHPGSHLANRHLDTGNVPADNVNLRAAEAAVVLGPFSLQGEWVRADASFLQEDRDLTLLDLDRFFTLEDRHFDGHYVQAGYILTGEHRVYDRTLAAFGGVEPRHNVGLRGGGLGAWELAARYEVLDLDDFDVRSGVIGGRAHGLTLGVNWYMTPNARLMFNYVRNDIRQFAYEGDMDIFQARFQARF